MILKMLKINLRATIIICIITSSLWVSAGFYINSVYASTDIEDPPGVLGDWYWDFNKGDLIIFNVTLSGTLDNSSYVAIYNISTIDWQILNKMAQDYNCSCVDLTQMVYNYDLEQLEETIVPPITSVGFNHTATPSLDEKLFPLEFIDEDGSYSPYLLFIPKNESNVNFSWAGMRTFEYYQWTGDYDSYTWNAATKSLNFSDSISGESYNATYFDNGTFSEIYKYLDYGGGDYEETRIKRIWDYIIPINESFVDDLEWSVNPGDVLYFGDAEDIGPYQYCKEYKFDIVGFKNKVLLSLTLEPTTYQLVLANKSIWNNNTETYDLQEVNTTIARANEMEKVILGAFGMGIGLLTPLIFPLGTNGTDFKNTPFGSYIDSPYFDQEIIGENIYHLWNSTNDNVLNITLTSDKILKSVIYKFSMMGMQFLASKFRKNITILTSGLNSVDLDPVGTFNTTVSFNSDFDIALYWATLPFTPTNVSLEDGIFYFDIYCNDSGAISGKINITIEIDTSIYNIYDFELWTFADYIGTGTWIKITSTFNTGTGELKAQLDHFSNYGVKAIPNAIPANPYIVINNDDISTDNTLVTLTLSADGASEMCFRNGTMGAWTAWEPYGTTKQLFLEGSTNNTAYTIYVKFQNIIGETVPIFDSILYVKEIKSVLFDGMYINHTFIMPGSGSGPSNFSYSYDSGDIFSVSWNNWMGSGSWDVNRQTRVTSNSIGMYLGDGYHTPAWIFTNALLYDIVPIVIPYGDHNFNITGELVYDLPGFGLVGVWILEDLTVAGGIAWYEKSTGILLNGTFLAGPLNNYTFDFVDTNVIFTYLNPPLNPSISINNGDASTNSTLVTLTLSADGATEMCFRNGTTGTWTNWEPYATTKQLYLAGSTNNTSYTIYVKFRNINGETTPVSDSILYLILTIPSNPSIEINNGDASTNSTLVTLTLSADGATEMCFRNGTTGTWTSWETYVTTKQLYLAGSINNTEYSICVKFRNTNGETTPVCDNILYLITENGDVDGGLEIPGYPLELLIISLIGSIGIIFIFNKYKRTKTRS